MSAAEQCLWWVDIEGRLLRRFDWAARAVRSWPTPERTGCIALHRDGGLVAAMETGVFHLRPRDDGALGCTPLAPVVHAAPGMRFNDGRCDRAGRFFAGTMVLDMALAQPAGALYRLDAGGLSQPLLRELVVPNGMAFSPDNRTMYVSDSHPSVRRVWAFDLGADGRPANRREFINMNAHPGRPDGAAVDAEGHYWVCANDAGLVHRFTPEGRLERSLAVPTPKPAMCAFGGPQLDQLFVTSIRLPGAPEPAGAVFVLRPGVRGLPEQPFDPGAAAPESPALDTFDFKPRRQP
jgi:sugar lactone lactonase YvrE